MGCPIRILRAPRLYAAPPERFAGLRVLLQPSAPRHSPRTLSSLFSIGCAHRCSHTRGAFLLCFTLAALTLNKIEVIMLLQLLVYICVASRAVPAYYATLWAGCQHFLRQNFARRRNSRSTPRFAITLFQYPQAGRERLGAPAASSGENIPLKPEEVK